MSSRSANRIVMRERPLRLEFHGSRDFITWASLYFAMTYWHNCERVLNPLTGVEDMVVVDEQRGRAAPDYPMGRPPHGYRSEYTIAAVRAVEIFNGP